MSTVNTNIIVSGSEFSGFKNYQAVTFSTAYGGGTLTVGTYAMVSATTPLNNSNAVSEVQVQFSGLETFYRLVPGSIAVDYPTSGTRTYEIEVIEYFLGGNLHMDFYIVNQTAGSVTVPAITFNCRAFLYVAPF